MEMKPLQVDDFSGGITDSILQGDPRRYAVADNYLITNDKKLQVRHGIIAIDNASYLLPSGDQRVNGMFTILNESKLLAASGRSLYVYENGTWDPPATPAGAEPIQGGDEKSQITIAEFQRQVYLTNDGGNLEQGTLPSKIYRDENNMWVARTAGLPRAWAKNAYSESTLLASCITLANSLRASMIAHLNDAQFQEITFPNNFNAQNSSNLHINLDKYSLSYFQAVTFPPGYPEVPNPIPTPAGQATDETSLYALVRALSLAYTHHMHDSTIGTTIQFPNAVRPVINGFMQNVPLYHFNLRNTGLGTIPIGPAIELQDDGLPTDLVTAALQLNDLKQKWYFHQYSINTHSFYNDPQVMGRYLVSVEKIEPLVYDTDSDGTRTLRENVPPTITPDWGDLYAYVNNLKYLFNGHVTNQLQSHIQDDTRYENIFNWGYDILQQVPLSDCSDLDSMYLLIYWIRCKYWFHWQDTQQSGLAAQIGTPSVGWTNLGISYTTTAGSPNISAVARRSDGSALMLTPGSWIYGGPWPELANSGYAGFSTSQVARIMSSGSGTAVMDRPATSSGTGWGGAVSGWKYHAYVDSAINPLYPAQDSQGLVGNPSAELPTTYFATANSLTGWKALADELFFCLAAHGTDAKVHVSQAFSQLPYGNMYQATGTQFFVPEVLTVSYAFFWTDEYKVEKNGIEYLVAGNPVTTGPVEIAASYPIGHTVKSQNPDLYPDAAIRVTRTNTISNLPTLSNSDGTNYDLSDIEMNIYRTSDDGTVYYRLDQIPVNTPTYVDTVNDAVEIPGVPSLTTRQQIYTTGGVVGYDQPPVSKFVHIVNGTVFYGGVWDGDQFFPNRLRQSVQYAPDAAPATFYDDFDDEITGLSSVRSNLVVFCKNSLFREGGGFNQLGQGALVHEKISDTLGCVNAKSIVQTEIGLFFAGNDGFYYTDGYQLIKISLEIDDTYERMTQSGSQRRNIYGAYDSVTRRVWWTMKDSPTQEENSVIFVFYLNYGVKPSGTFTKLVNPSCLEISSLVFQEGVAYLGHKNGFVLKTDSATKTDPIIVKTEPPSSWVRTHIPYEYTSCAMDLGTTFNRKWATKLHVTGDNTGNMSIQPYVIRDMNSDYKGIRPLAAINYTDNVWWGWPTCVWGDPTAVWNNKGKMDLFRRFPQTTLRSDFLQVGFKPASVVVYASSVAFPFGANALTNPATNEVTIITPSGYTAIVWPLDVVNMEISFSIDNYENKYKIISVAGNVIEVEDPDLTLPSVLVGDGMEWQISGIKKEQRPTITSYVIHYTYLGDAVQAYPGKASNSGPGNGGANP